MKIVLVIKVEFKCKIKWLKYKGKKIMIIVYNKGYKKLNK